MSYINPNSNIPAQLVGIDFWLDRLRLFMQQLGWLEIIHGRAYREPEKRNRKTYYRPIVYTGNGHYQEVDFNKNVDSQCFYYVLDPGETETQLNSDGVRYRNFNYNLDIICLWDEDKVKKRETRYNFPQRIDQIIQNETFQLLDDVTFFTLNQIYNSSEEVFRDFDIDHAKRQTFMYPYNGMKLRGRLDVERQCETGIPGLDNLDFQI